MGPPRTAAARLQRRDAGRVRRWLANAGLHAGTLLRGAEAADAMVKEVLELLGEAGTEEMPAERAEAVLKARAGELGGGYEPGESELMANVAVLANLMDLDAAEADVLALFAAISSQPALQRILERIDVRSRHQACRAIALVLGYEYEVARHALSSESTLARYHVLNISGGSYDFSQFSLLNEDLERALSSAAPGSDELLDAFFSRSLPATLNRDDFAHMETRVGTLFQMLRGASAAGARGVNALLYGIAGTGKTELARLLAVELGWTAYEVKTTNRDGSASSGDERMASYFMAQRFLANQNKRLLIFDEIEDLFGQHGFERARLGKLFMNRLLEESAVPTIWIANEIDALDAAARRRFDFSISFGPLPGSGRRRAVERHLADLGINDELKSSLVRRETLLPAQVRTGRKVAGFVAPSSAEEALMQTIDASMRLLGQPIPRKAAPLLFEVALCNADADIEKVVQGIRKIECQATIALYGPPGAGKSALAGYIAEKLNRRPVRMGPSDWLSSFLGETEERVARLFDGIDVETEAIVIEEADELLATRNEARHSWEIRLANELLIQLEGFRGLVFLTTNALERMDAAALRRCHLKLKLGYMRAEQRLMMWQQQTRLSAEGQPAARLETMDRLTAGDFVTVGVQARILGEHWTAMDWIEALERELALRPQRVRSAGFVVA